jgi:hypothetical protein
MRFGMAKCYHGGNIAPLCRFVEDRYFKILDNRNYRWANELTLNRNETDPRRRPKTGEPIGDILEKMHKNLQLRRYIVASLGFERIWGAEA